MSTHETSTSRETVWIRSGEGRLEREIFGLVPFDQVPPSPYYTPSPGWWLSARAWMDDDGLHVIVAHDCTEGRDTHIMPWPTWQAVDGHLDPSYTCDICGFHDRPLIEWQATTAFRSSPVTDASRDTRSSRG